MPQRPNILFLLSGEHGFRYVSHRAREAGGEAPAKPFPATRRIAREIPLD